MREVAPYLVRLHRDAPFTRWVLSEGWGQRWGIFAVATEGVRMLRRHFRTLVMVYGPDGKPMYFRYYDPRVLRTYLPTCNAEEASIVFGPVRWYLAEDPKGGGALRFSKEGQAVRVEPIKLGAAVQTTPEM